MGGGGKNGDFWMTSFVNEPLTSNLLLLYEDNIF